MWQDRNPESPVASPRWTSEDFVRLQGVVKDLGDLNRQLMAFTASPDELDEEVEVEVEVEDEPVEEQNVKSKAPSLADVATLPSGMPPNWTPLMVLVDSPPGQLGGIEYAYSMLCTLLQHMSAQGAYAVMVTTVLCCNAPGNGVV
ncbi:unnamed protein product [Symbiodinium sp. CCMP2592]|nr:unnamed protein product [Symbiodinium sp. CCMP2592]CAE7510504.1 unnamed protein product [Symbiodinium sp. CCMP2592]